MIRDEYRIECASWDADRSAIRAVREQVFIVEQGVLQSDEWDTQDERSRHVLALDSEGHAVGTARLTPDRCVGRMAVLSQWRGRGIGSAMLRVLLEQARALGYRIIEMHAQTHALSFYERFGFTPIGDEFLECNIPHQSMRLTLAEPEARELPPVAHPPAARLLQTEDRADALAALLELLRDALQEVAIFTRDLDPGLLDVADILDELKRIGLSGRNARVRVLLKEPRVPVAKGHRLLTLAQRLPTPMQLRIPIEPNDLAAPSAFVINDRGGYWYRPLGDRFEGEGSTFAPARHRELLQRFDETWERAETSVELRALDL
ncbi:MAG: GNAT family N-acetyltransferase [Rhodanobacteraceae bacterium]